VTSNRHLQQNGIASQTTVIFVVTALGILDHTHTFVFIMYNNNQESLYDLDWRGKWFQFVYC